MKLKKLLEKLRKRITVLALAMIAIQPVLVGGMMMPAKTLAATPKTPLAVVVTPANHVVISEVQTATEEFVELYNPTSASVDLSGWKIQYKSATGESWSVRATIAAEKSIQSNGFYLVGTDGITPAPDTSMSAGLSADAGHVRLVDSENNPIDKVGYGTTANSPETAPAAAPDTDESIQRNPIWKDTDNNSIDFAVKTESDPQNSASPIVDCIAPTVVLSTEATATTNQNPFSVTAKFSENVTGFITTDVVVSNGTVSNFAAVDGKTFTFDVAPVADGAVTVDVVGGAAEDLAGNGNAAATQLSRVYDGTAPDKVSGLTATAGNNSITLSWVNPADLDFAGVNIYRSTEKGSLGALINTSELVTGTNLSDSTVVNGTTYYYTVKAVDTTGNESLGSDQVSATPVAPVVVTTVVTTVAQTPTTNETFGASSDQGEVKADTTVNPDDSKKDENKDNQDTKTKDNKSMPLWGIIFLLILAGIGGYLFYSQNPNQTTNGKK